jgi:ribosomal protein L30/L7E
MARVRVTQVRSAIVKDDRPDIRGMIAKVSHLVRVEEVREETSE